MYKVLCYPAFGNLSVFEGTSVTTFSVVPKLQPIKRWTVAIKAKLLDMLLSYKIDVGEVLDFYPDLSAEESCSSGGKHTSRTDVQACAAPT